MLKWSSSIAHDFTWIKKRTSTREGWGVEKDWQFEISRCKLASQVVLAVKNLPANAGDVRDSGLIPGSGRSPRAGHCNPLQYSCLETPVDRRARWTTVLRVAQSRTKLKQFSTHVQTIIYRMDKQQEIKPVHAKGNQS